MTIKPGIYPELSNKEYHASDAIGSSQIVSFKHSPKIYEYEYLKGNKPPVSQAVIMGQAMHTYLLEPGLFHKEFKVAPESIPDKRKKDWKEFDASDNKISLLHKDFKVIEDMRNSLMSIEAIGALLKDEDGIYEQSYFANCPLTGMMLKARPDILLKDCIIDLKTTGLSLGVSDYARNAYNTQKYIQAYHHKNVVEIATGKQIFGVFHIVISTQAPYLCRFVELGSEWTEYGRLQCEEILVNMQEAAEENNYPGFVNEDEIIDLPFPAWGGTEIN